MSPDADRPSPDERGSVKEHPGGAAQRQGTPPGGTSAPSRLFDHLAGGETFEVTVPDPLPAFSDAVGVDDVETSRAGAERARSSAGRVRELVRGAHERHPDGLTDDELAQLLPSEHPGTSAKRRSDLVRAGVLVDSGQRRDTRRGVAAIVWKIVR